MKTHVILRLLNNSPFYFMENICKTSVRDELDRLKIEFQRQSNNGALSNENCLLMQGVFALLELIISIFFKNKTTETDKNSSKPASLTDKDESVLIDKGGKGKTELNDSACNTRIAVTTRISNVSVYDVCGENISDTPYLKHERRTKNLYRV